MAIMMKHQLKTVYKRTEFNYYLVKLVGTRLNPTNLNC